MTRCLLCFTTILLFHLHTAAQITIVYPEGRNPVTGSASPDALTPVRSLAEVGIADPFTIAKADALVEKALAAAAFPGCRVLAAKDGKIFYDKSFGFLTYDRITPVTPSTVYDLASLTKVVSTTLAIMRLQEQQRINLDKTLGDYLPITQGTDKASLTLRNLLLHQAGLKAWIPFYKSLLDSTGKKLRDTVVCTKWDGCYSVHVSKDLFLREDYEDSVWNAILTSPLENKGRFVYSDLDYYFLAAVIERVTGKPLNRYVAEQFYTPMGLRMTGYLPLEFIRPDLIAPTENDQTFRHQTLQGYVHDPGAAMLGGVAGHAGVFSTAGEVAAIFQMLLSEGVWHGKRYFKPETVRYFTGYGSAISRRGLGFDKPAPDAYDAGPVSNRCSGYTFGHQGFTGTCAWADPATGVVFVFLSNRVYPNAENNTINRLATRITVQDILYEALGIPDDTGRAAVRRMQLAAK
jgi:CubicO group peptidase (beta-lactamase class C family)